jgi:bifunctional UDP-N-acetylglucosamine pyrophosphorylase/glucosamine-1-phosphate N-acetyltransferase
MADAVLAARTHLEALGDAPLYVTQAQDVVEGRLHADLLETWERSPGLAGLIAAQRVKDYFPGGYLTLDGQRVTAVVEKPGAGNEPSDLVNLVAHVHASASQLIGSLEAEIRRDSSTDDAYERALTRLMATGEFRASVYEGRWQALKYPWHLLDVADMMLDLWTMGVESPGPDYEQREDGVFVGREVRIFPGAYVVAPSLIGHGSTIGHNALVRGSIIGPRCVVGFGSEVARSVLFEGVELHHNYAGDSIFDRRSAMGYGAVTANFRIDDRTVPSVIAGERVDSARMKLGLVAGAGVRIGVNTSTMPGVKIGAGAMIGPNINVTRDVPDGARVLDESKYGRF